MKKVLKGKIMKRFCKTTAVVCGTLVFAACGDNVTEATNVNEKPAISVLESGEKIAKQVCDTANVGAMLFVDDSASVFVCEGKNGTRLKGVMGKMQMMVTTENPAV